jgi:hypothetical protein
MPYKKELVMHVSSVVALLVCSSSLALAQNQGKEKLCNSASATTVHRDGGVTVQKVVLSGKWGSNEATAYIPDREIADAAIVFSHSTILSDSGASVNLLSFALTLAHAGAAVIVPQRSLVWLPRRRSENREGAVVICAERWLVDHTKVINDGEPTVDEKNAVVREGYAYVGPRLCDPEEISHCKLTVPFSGGDCFLRHHCRHAVWVPMGETESGDNTNRILSDGGLKAAWWLQQRLKLAAIEALTSQSRWSVK